MTTKDQSRMPAGIPYIVANEFAERFCYYGINAILSVYLVNFLHFGDARSDLEQPQARSEEHTSELQSLMRISYAVFCLKNKKTTYYHSTEQIPSTRSKHPINKSGSHRN